MTEISFDRAYRLARRIVIGTLGGTILAVGVALLVLPGPAFLVIPVGLSILAIEFAFARRWMRIVAIRTGMRPPEDAHSESEAKWAGVEYRPRRRHTHRDCEDPDEPTLAPSSRRAASAD